jgi:hypothetical protein
MGNRGFPSKLISLNLIEQTHSPFPTSVKIHFSFYMALQIHFSFPIIRIIPWDGGTSALKF